MDIDIFCYSSYNWASWSYHFEKWSSILAFIFGTWYGDGMEKYCTISVDISVQCWNRSNDIVVYSGSEATPTTVTLFGNCLIH